MTDKNHEQVKVLDKGFVRLVDFMGGDQGVVDAARVSYGGVSKGPDADTQSLSSATPPS